jgi:hypothetical protein
MRRLLVLTIPLAVAGVLAATAFAAVIVSVAIDTYEAPSDGFAGPYFTPTLDAGQPYLMTVSGTYSFWNPSTWGTWTGSNATNACAGTAEELPQTLSAATSNGIVGVDPEYFFALPNGASLCPGPTPAHAVNLQISLDGGSTFTHLEPINSDFNASHSYQYLVVGLGVPAAIGFQLLDGRTTDNYGVLTATVEATDAGAFATGGGTVDVDGGNANFGFVGRNQKGRLQGTLEYHDDAGTKVAADTITGVLVLKSNNSAYIVGSASVDGVPGHTFVLMVQDNDEPGAGADTFRLDLDGTTVASGVLTGGNVQVHAK